MAKELKIKVKNLERMEFELIENGQIGDWISLKDFQTTDLENIKNTIQDQVVRWKNELREQVREEEVHNFRNAFTSGEHYQNLVKKANSLEVENDQMKKTFELKIKDAVNDFKNSQEFKNLEKTNIELKNDNENLKQQADLQLKNAINEFKNSETYQNLITTKSNYENLIKQNQIEKENLELTLKAEFEAYHQAEIKKLADKNMLLEEEVKRKQISNIKQMGEEFEIWIQNKYDEVFHTSKDTKIEKANQIIGGIKPDFIFYVIDNEKKLTIEKVVIEAKTQGHSGKTKNSDHYEKLERDRKNNNAEYSLLISELEPEQTFMIKKVPDYENMFVIRPAYFTTFLSLIRHISLKRKAILNVEQNIENKEKILEDFEKMKKEVLENSLRHIETQCEKIKTKADSISKSAKDILDCAELILEKHLRTATKKIEEFKITKVVKAIEKLENF